MKRLCTIVMSGAIASFASSPAGADGLTRFQDSVTLPSGMVLRREFNWTLSGRWDLFASDGRTRLARDIEFVCFNDRYVYVQARERGYEGLYDAESDSRLQVEYSEAMDISGLHKDGESCGGYYTGWIGPGLLLDDGRYPFVPPCAWRNIDDDSLRDRDWFERPCAPGSWPPGQP